MRTNITRIKKKAAGGKTGKESDKNKEAMRRTVLKKGSIETAAAWIIGVK